MGVQFANNAASTLASTITNVATTLSVQVGDGAKFPAASLISGNYFYATLIDASNNLEIVKVTDRSTDTFTVIRARESTTARSFTSGCRIELRVTAAGLSELPNRAIITSDIADGNVTTAKLATLAGLSAAVYGGVGIFPQFTVNVKGQITAATSVSGFVQRNQYDLVDSPFTWTKPAAGSLVRIQAWGAGAGGGRSAAGNAGGGGGGGEYQEHWFALADLPASITGVVGAGGVGATVDGTVGGDGGSTTITISGTTLTVFGGSGGNFNAGAFAFGGSGAGPLSNSGGGQGSNTVNAGKGGLWTGGAGGAGSNVNSSSLCTGGDAIWGGAGGGGGADNTDATNRCRGGTSVFGGGGGRGSVDVGTTPVLATDGAVPAGGGGGSEASNAGSGGAGRVIITVY